MVEHRKGLNRTLFWLYSGHGRWPSIFRWSMLVFDLATIALFWRVRKPAALLLVPYFLWVSFAACLTFAVWKLNPRLLS